MNRITTTRLKKMKQGGEKIACLTAYDASFAHILDAAGVEILLVGDSLGMVIQGQETTLPVSLDEMIYHARAVRTGSEKALLMVDMPFMADATPEQAMHSAGRLMKEGGAQMVKLEGGSVLLETVQALAARGIPVCSHLGLLPQSVHKQGGYRVQGRDEAGALDMISDASAMQAAGADMLLLECVPATLAAEITRAVEIPVIGIGAGPDVDAQVLVLYDMLGITPGKRPSFSHDFLADSGDISAAVAAYVQAVKGGSFPSSAHSF
ncbi:MAG: 3-methyl-2-oxobutanoate hydroxymethyltransferase [Gammaproteobacteria bacterium]|nr:3-methyl-2-oxobutanoate hydroxymethyltransferase [Gammaproteobacteria bacterium]MCF6362277.1 3-methyl-2-oxobutanoate hydroxymethyltransferase [Gammaproteobacteria bacterium]